MRGFCPHIGLRITIDVHIARLHIFTVLHRRSYIVTTRKLEQPNNMSHPHRTFQLCEFSTLFGRDAHYFLFIQRESNSEALAHFEANVRHAVSTRHAKFFPRVYTETDLTNIQASCLDILGCFVGTNDYVSYLAVVGKIEIQPLGEMRDEWKEEHEWFEKTFEDTKAPNWARGLGVESNQVIDLETDNYEPLGPLK
jgi:hypothetical protein